MKRNTALFGASAAVGLTAAAGLIMTSATSSAAAAKPTLYGVAYSTTTGSAGFAFGNIVDPDGVFVAKAEVVKGISVVGYEMPLLKTGPIGVATGCENGKPVVAVKGGGASGTYTTKTTVSAAKFTGNKYAAGSVTFLASAGDITVGAYYDLTASGTGKYVEIGGVSGCATATTPPSSSSSSSTTSPTTPPSSSSSSTTSPTTPPSSSSSSTTSPTTGPTNTTTPTGPVSPTSSPTSTATQPPTPTATTTTLPVTG
ncbi:hypothetical protein V3G39_00985 [Dermatophilaceae bacterium Sec6.4]